MHSSGIGIDWNHWLERWDEQQQGYLPQREERFQAMIDIVGEVCDGAGSEQRIPRVLDLGCGPGCVSSRLLERLPRAQCVAVDIDPVLLEIGRGALGDAGGHIEWVEANLRDTDWVNALPEGVRFDAVLTTTALHWLGADRLLGVYRDLADLVKEGGIVLNGDHLFYGSDKPTLRDLMQNLRKKRQENSHTVDGVETWAQWWKELSREPGMDILFAERRRRFGERHSTLRAPIYAFHEGALLDAGFQEVDVVWQDLDNRILAAVR